MTIISDATKRDQILRLVEDTLSPLQPKNFRLKVVSAMAEDDWYYVVVRPDQTEVRSYDYYDILARAEEKLQDENHLKVLLVPAVAE